MHPAYRQINLHHLLYRRLQRAQCAQRHFIVLGEDGLNIRMRGQQVLHDVQTLSTVGGNRRAGWRRH